MTLHDWLLAYVFTMDNAEQLYPEYIMITESVITILCVCLIFRAVLGIFNIFFR